VSSLLWLLYFVLPSEGRLVDGLPLGRLDTVGVLLVLWIAAHRVRIAGARAAGALAIAATIAAAAVPGDRGFNARYFATDTTAGPHERSTEFRREAFTRVDRRLDFVLNERDFPLAFFNDHTRFNFMRMGEPNRRFLPFAVAWTGWLHVPDHQPRTYYLHAPQASAQLTIDTLPVVAVDRGSQPVTREMALAAGWHRLHITFSSPAGSPREFSAGEIAGGDRRPFDGDNVRAERIDGRQMMVWRLFGVLKDSADVIAVGWLAALSGLLLLRRAGEIWLRRTDVGAAAAALFVAAGAAEALRFAWPWATRLRILTGGDDTLVYEGYARDILFNGLLMNGGAPAGAGEPFYFQALYPYFLAATHAVFGESFFGAVFLQRWLVALTAVALMRIAIMLRGHAVWPFALGIGAPFAYWKLAPISADLLSEALYVPLLAAWAMVCIDLGRRATTGGALVAGLVGGVTAITRSTVLLAWPVVWAALFVVLRHRPRRLRRLVTVAGVSLAVFSLIAVRNAIVSHRFAPMPSEFGITLKGGNEPPPGLVIDVAARKSLYDRLPVDGHTAEVLEFALSAPGSFAANLGRKALFALGFYEPYAPGWGYSPVYIATWTSAGFGIALLVRSGTASLLTLLPFAIALTQYVALVLVYPKGERLIVPIHTLLIPYAAVAAQALWQRATAARSPSPR